MSRFIIFLSLLAVCINTEAQISEQIYVKDVSNPEVNLNGTWQICLEPSGRFWELNQGNMLWHDIQVPGEVMMQGYPIKHDIPFVYKKSFTLPQDINAKTVKLRFEGVYSFARVWVNGIFIRDHLGGFTTWDCDISKAIRPGEKATIIVEVTDRADEISYASGYAKHQIGGILRNVKLLTLPVNYPETISISTDLDSKFQHANLIVKGKINNHPEENIEISLALFDPENTAIPLKNTVLKLKDSKDFSFENNILDPLKWDAEHPNLYELKISLLENGDMLWQKNIPVGFREVAVQGNKLLVNGKEVKLRGACRHDIHPLLGRLSTPEYDLKDVLLAKEANMNFIRTSHYPPSDNFLSLCDIYGLYVEDETAVCFVGSHRTEEYRPGDSENEPEFTDRYLMQLAEMVNNHKNHPSVIMWSIGNENEFGSNFKRSFDWVKENDDTRPVIFSYPGKVPEGIDSYEILSMHYPDTSGNMNQYGIKTIDFGFKQMPVIFDEWAHVACYNNFTVIEDPNIRDFWGRSLDMMWQKTFEADGGLGGAIWGMIDETFMLPDSLPGYNEWWGKIDKNVIPAAYTGNTVGYGEWGIVDTWRRKKPEFWNTKKAYSPVKLLQTEVENYKEGSQVTLPLYNRFDHTNIDELTIKLFYKDEERIIKSPSIKPHTKGFLKINMVKWDPGLPVILEFTDSDDALIDKYELNLKSAKTTIGSKPMVGNINVEETKDQLIILCNTHSKILIDKNTGLIQKIIKASDTLSLSGPYINLRTKGKAVMYSYHEITDYGESWNLKGLSYNVEPNNVKVHLKGEIKDLSAVEFSLNISSDGIVIINYKIKKIPDEFIREIGIRFELENDIDSLSWSRDSYWSYYPSDHLSTRTGTVGLYANDIKYYRTRPEKNWNLDTKSFYYEGTEHESPGDQLTYQAKSTKEDIIQYRLLKENSIILSVQSDGRHSCRIAKNDESLHLFINNKIDYVDLSWGNYQRNIKIKEEYENDISLRLF
jgi:hypothetical protein